jgi:hypothetical protein
MVTVLLPTTNRPLFLRTALASVERQTARQKIGQVIVSENANGRDSEAICAEFPNLPIAYKFRDPAVDSLRHFRLLLSETETQHVAMLHDDDWWHPDHLSNGLRCLDLHGGVATYWAAFFRVFGESSSMTHLNSSFWAGAGYPRLDEMWKLEPKQVILSCLWYTPGHYSSLITNTQLLDSCCDTYMERKNPFDNDRIIATELSKRAPTYFNPIPELWVRYHTQNDTIRFEKTRDTYIQATSHYLIDEAEALGFDVQAELEQLLLACPPSERLYVYDSFEKGSIAVLKARGKMPPTLAQHRARTLLARYAKAVIRRLKKLEYRLVAGAPRPASQATKPAALQAHAHDRLERGEIENNTRDTDRRT